MAHLSRIRNGVETNPTGVLLGGFAQAFRVSPLVWFEAEAFDDEHSRLVRERDALLGKEL